MEGSLRIVILEDSRDDVFLIERELKNAGMNFVSLVVSQRAPFENGLRQFQPDLILADHFLPDFNSIEALAIVKEYEREKGISIPFILVTGTVSEEFSVRSIKAGADDYILKDRLKRLPTSIENALEKCRIENERSKYLNEVIANESLMKEAEGLAHFSSWQADLLTGKYLWSDETYRIYGYEPGEIAPSYEIFLQHLHPDDLDSARSLHDQLINKLDWYENDFRIIDRSGNVKHLASKILVKRNADLQAIGFVGVNLDITERKRTEIQLQKSQQEYKSLFDKNPDSVYSLDLNGRFTKVNDSVLKLSGLSEADLLGQEFQPFVAESDSQRVVSHFSAASRGIPQRYQAKLADGNGKQLMLDITNIPIVVNGEIIGVHGIAKDITRRKELEILLEKVYRLARIGGWEFDVVQNKITWTTITKELHEVPADFIPDLKSGIAFFKEGFSRETIIQAINRAMESGQPFDVELQVITGKGNLRWVRAIGETEFKDGKCLRLYGSFQDIHERKEATEAIKEAYQDKVRILESIGDAFFTVDKQWMITYWNKVAESKLLIPRELAIGKNLWELFRDAAPLAFYDQYHRAMKEDTDVHFQAYYPALNMWVDASAYPSSEGLSVYFRDITELKTHMEEIEGQNIKLKQIAWTQSHEVRAPLARLMGLIQLINGYPDAEANLTDTLNHLWNSANELDQVVRKIVRMTEDLGPGKQ